MTKRAIAYARCSSDDVGKDALNIQGQLRTCKKYCQEKGYHLVTELHEDPKGASGRAFDLPALLEALEYAKQGLFDVLVVRDIKRFSREGGKIGNWEKRFKKYNVSLEFTDMNFDQTPGGKFTRAVMEAASEMEADDIAFRTHMGKVNRIKAGSIIVAKRPPYGYNVVKEGIYYRLVIREDEAKVVKLIFDLFTNHDYGVRKIVRHLNELRVPTPVDKGDRARIRSKRRGYGEWSQGTVRSILVRKTYIGKWVSHRDSEPIEVDCEPIIEKKTWKLAQERFKENKCFIENRRKAGKIPQHDYLVSKRVTCGLCGYSMGCNLHRKKGRRDQIWVNTYYVCSSSKRSTAIENCDSPYYRSNDVDEAVWKVIKEYFRNAEQLEQVLEARVNQANSSPLVERLKILDEQIAEYENELRNIFRLAVKGNFPEHLVESETKRIQDLLSNAYKRKAELEEIISEREITTEQIRSFREYAEMINAGLSLADSNFEARKRLVDLLRTRVTLTVENGKRVVYINTVLEESNIRVFINSTRQPKNGATPVDNVSGNSSFHRTKLTP